MHGGAGSGAPQGNQSALTTGLHTHEAVAQRKAVNALLRQARQLLEDLD